MHRRVTINVCEMELQYVPIHTQSWNVSNEVSEVVEDKGVEDWREDGFDKGPWE